MVRITVGIQWVHNEILFKTKSFFRSNPVVVVDG